MITTVQPSAYDVYTMHGVLIGRNMQLSALGKGSYIIRSKADPLKGRNYIEIIALCYNIVTPLAIMVSGYLFIFAYILNSFVL